MFDLFEISFASEQVHLREEGGMASKILDRSWKRSFLTVIIEGWVAAEICLVQSRRDEAGSQLIRQTQDVVLALELMHLVLVKSYGKPALLLYRITKRTTRRLRLEKQASRFENFPVEVGLPLSQRIIPLLHSFEHRSLLSRCPVST